MVIATNPVEEFIFYLSEDMALEKPKRTAWKILALNVSQRSKLEDGRAMGTMDDAGELTGFAIRSGSVVLECIRAGLRGVENFNDADGSEVPYEQAKKMMNVLGKNVLPPSDDFLDRIAPRHRQEIANAIELNTRVTAEEGKG